mmetsp:Transcript_39689/g.119254  ORF Transcript_39689/g.119254 Transcript_39689/m.119254 type:complete len:331 (-) Transcript_39689:77-1069(-)
MLSTITLLSTLGVAASFSASSDVRIVGMPGGQTQTLPSNYIRSFPRWFAESLRKDEGEGEDEDEQQNIAVERLRTAGDDTFVDPTSTTELWWPSDVTRIQVRPALDVLMKGGTPNYALAGLNARCFSADGTAWRNWGMHSQPLAAQWTSFGISVEGRFRVECFLGKAGGAEENGGGDDDDGQDSGQSDEKNYEWERLFPGSLGSLDDTSSAHLMFGAERMKKVVESLGIFLSGIDENSPLSDGFHVVSFPLTKDWIELPEFEEDEGITGYKLSCLATAEPDAKALLGMDDGLLEMTATSVLDIDVSKTSSGSESEYLPDSYRPLYAAQKA